MTLKDYRKGIARLALLEELYSRITGYFAAEQYRFCRICSARVSATKAATEMDHLGGCIGADIVRSIDQTEADLVALANRGGMTA